MNLRDIQSSLCTVIAIPVTPFNADGSIDFARYRQLVSRMVDGGIRVVTPNGNTSEFYSLTPAEHERSVEATIAGVTESSNDALVLAGVGFDEATAVTMARFAHDAGAEAIMVHQPVHPYLSADGWIAYHKAIADAVPDLGIVPYLRNSAIDGATLSQLADACPNFVGIKYAVADPIRFAKTVNEVGRARIAWVCGLAESWAPFFAVGGAQGFTSGLVNITTDLSLRMQSCLEGGDYPGAMAIWAQVKPFEELRARRNNANNVSGVKEAMAQVGLCERTVRSPISVLSVEERAEVSQILVQLGVASEVVRP